MTTKLLSVALLGASVLATAAYAQSSPPASSTSTPAATASSTTTTVTADQKMVMKGSWRASKLMGLNVYNEANEKLGDINELIVGKDGKINAVVIGVGGFLGMGEHDIAVTIDKLKFVEEAVRTSSAAPSTTTTATRETTTTGAATAPATSPTTTTTTTTSASTANVNDWTPDHAVMSGTKDQLKAMPQFKYSDYN